MSYVAPHSGDSRSNNAPARHLRHLDGWRGLAIGAVLLGHFWLDKRLPGVSTLGVDLFFVLSGRLMAHILFVQKSELPTFFARRLSRVYPALLTFVALVTIAFWFTPYRHGVLAAGLGLTFTINYAMIYGHPVALLDHLWSLCVEEHGYVLLALIALAVRRWSLPAAAIVATIGTAALVNGIYQSAVLDRSYFDVFWRTDVQIAGLFLSGGLYLAFRNFSASWMSWISPLALLAGVSLKLFGDNVALTFGLGTILLAVAVSTIDRSVAPMRSMFSIAPLTRLGLWSYSLYLWQQPFYKLHNNTAAPVAVWVACAFITAIASFYLVEQPARRRLNGLTNRIVAPLQARYSRAA